MMDPHPRCYIPGFIAIGFLVLEKKILKGFTIYGHDDHLGNVTKNPRTKFRFPAPLKLQMKFGFNRLSGFRGEDVKNVKEGWTDDGRTTDALLYFYLR